MDRVRSPGRLVGAGIAVALLLGVAWYGYRRAMDADGGAFFPERMTRGLVHAIAAGDTAEVRRRAARGADLDGLTRHGRWSVLTWAINYHPELAPLLLDLGADPDLVPAGGQPPLWTAIARGQPTTVRALLDHGADPNAGRLIPTRPVLFDALWTSEHQTFRLLLERGADPRSINDDGATIALEAARQERWDDARLALEAGADPGRPAADGSTLASLVGARATDPAVAEREDYLKLVDRLETKGRETEAAASGGTGAPLEPKTRPGPPG